MGKLLIYLADLAHTYAVSEESLTVPLNIGYVKAYAIAALDDIEVVLFKHPERLLRAVSERAPDVVGLSNYGWSENLNIQVGSYLKRRLPHALFAVGGPNIDPEPEHRRKFLARHRYADFAVIDGGEEPFAELVEWWRTDGKDRSRLPRNLIWLEGDEVRQTSERPLEKTIRDIPSPYLDGYLDEFLAAGMAPLIETNRGCPFRCTFCAWGMASKDLVRRFDLDTALAEIEYIGEHSRARNWIVCDANFGILKRDVEIAQAIRRVKDRNKKPERCHVWLAKNVTDRNLEIGAILGDMVVPVMAVQSMDAEVLKNIKRDNISLDTYRKYQEKFHSIGSTTYSDVIVPLPGETMESHLQGLRELFECDVDVIQNHNMRMLAGAETNSSATRQEYGFRTRYRLIHGDAGIYPSPDGEQIKAFEIEESLRSTTTMSEDDLFRLRKLHFLVDFCWNIDVYKPLLALARKHGVNPLNVLEKAVDAGADDPVVGALWTEFDQASRSEWFDSEAAIRDHFADSANFERLVNQEYEKLNIQFAVRILEHYKVAFDQLMLRVLTDIGVTGAELAPTAAFTFASYPPLHENRSEIVVSVGAGGGGSAADMRLVPSPRRSDLVDIVARRRGRSVSKVLNTQGFRLRDLGYVAAKQALAAAG